MRCRRGDLVVCVWSAFPELIGRVFTVTRQSMVWPDCWMTSPPQFSDEGPRVAMVFVDHHLRPIRDPGDDAVDEMVQKLGKPEEVTA